MSAADKAVQSVGITSEHLRAFRAFGDEVEAAVERALDAGVPVGMVVALLHGVAHVQTAEMMRND